MHFAIFSRLSSYGNYSVRVEVLKPALNQQNYLRASLSTQVKVGRKAVEISTTFSLFSQRFKMFQVPPNTVNAASLSDPWTSLIGEDLVSSITLQEDWEKQLRLIPTFIFIPLLSGRVFSLINCQPFNA